MLLKSFATSAILSLFAVNAQASTTPYVIDLESSAASYRHQLQVDTRLQADWFGATGDGVTEDTRAIQRTLDINHARGGGSIYLPPGVYLVNSLTGYSNTTLVGDYGRSVLRQAADAQYVLSINPASGGSPDPVDNATNIVIEDITFRGRSIEDGFSEFRYLLNLNACSHVAVQHCQFLAPQGDAVYVGSGNTGAIERHNLDITCLAQCLLDLKSQWQATLAKLGVCVIVGTIGCAPTDRIDLADVSANW